MVILKNFLTNILRMKLTENCFIIFLLYKSYSSIKTHLIFNNKKMWFLFNFYLISLIISVINFPSEKNLLLSFQEKISHKDFI